MAYIYNSDIATRVGAAAYIQLTDDFGSGAANESVVDEARQGAEGEVNSYLARRFAVPIDLSRNPELRGVLASITLDLAEHRLRLRRPPVPSEAVDRRTAALAWLKGVSYGSIELPAATDLPASPVGEFRGRATGSERTRTHDEMHGY